MTTPTTPTTSHDVPRRVSRPVHALETALYALLVALLVEAIPLPLVPRLLLILLGLGVFLTLGTWAQIRCWGSFIVPALTPARVSIALFTGATALLPTLFPQSAAPGWRAALTILLAAVFYVLSRWDDARTVELLRHREAAQQACSAGRASSTRPPV